MCEFFFFGFLLDLLLRLIHLISWFALVLAWRSLIELLLLLLLMLNNVVLQFLLFNVDAMLLLLLNARRWCFVVPSAWCCCYSSCLTLLFYCFSCSMLLLYDFSCLTLLLLLLLDVVVTSLSQSYYYFLLNMFAPLAQCYCFFVRLGISLLHLWCCCSLLLHQCCCFCSSCFRLVFSPLYFLHVWEELFKFEFFKPNLEDEIFFSTFVCWWIFLIVLVFGKCWLTMCLFVICKNYLNIVHLILHIASHSHNCIVYFFNTLHFFLWT